MHGGFSSGARDVFWETDSEGVRIGNIYGEDLPTPTLEKLSEEGKRQLGFS